jgi:hypothetical protein
MAATLDRRARRSRTFLSAKIIMPNGNSVIDCVVRDVSRSGARIKVDEVAVVPAQFGLLIGSENQRERCRVVWRRPTEIGVTFDQTCRWARSANAASWDRLRRRSIERDRSELFESLREDRLSALVSPIKLQPRAGHSETERSVQRLTRLFGAL